MTSTSGAPVPARTVPAIERAKAKLLEGRPLAQEGYERQERKLADFDALIRQRLAGAAATMGRLFNHVRIEQALPTREMASQAGISRTTLNDLLQGAGVRGPTLLTLLSIAEIANLDFVVGFVPKGRGQAVRDAIARAEPDQKDLFGVL